jgi:hypothetical protein
MSCFGSSEVTNNGIITTTTKNTVFKPEDCPKYEGGYTNCACAEELTFRCAPGYYGTATSSLKGCAECPDNSIPCSGGNGSTFSCMAGYYKNGTECTACPTGGTSVVGSTDITDCYIPKNTTDSDTTGGFTYTDNCYYKK